MINNEILLVRGDSSQDYIYIIGCCLCFCSLLLMGRFSSVSAPRTSQTSHCPNLALPKPCISQTLHFPNFAFPKPRTSQTSHLALPKLRTFQTSHLPNLALPKPHTSQTAHFPNLALPKGSHTTPLVGCSSVAVRTSDAQSR